MLWICMRQRYQFIVLDCPPALDLLTLNALVAADTVLIPMQAEYFALEGVTELLDTIDRIRIDLNRGLAVEGVVLTMFDERTNLSQSVANELRGFFGELMCETAIPRNVRSGRSAQPRPAGAGVRSALARSRGVSCSGRRNHEAGEEGGEGCGVRDGSWLLAFGSCQMRRDERVADGATPRSGGNSRPAHETLLRNSRLSDKGGKNVRQPLRGDR